MRVRGGAGYLYLHIIDIVGGVVIVIVRFNDLLRFVAGTDRHVC